MINGVGMEWSQSQRPASNPYITASECIIIQIHITLQCSVYLSAKELSSPFPGEWRVASIIFANPEFLHGERI